MAAELSVSKPSVSVAMKAFKNEGYISVSQTGEITLTQKGLEIAEKVYERHNVIANMLISIGVSPKIACEDSCKIEHIISEETFEKLKDFIRKN